jgi:hypothetical protein
MAATTTLFNFRLPKKASRQLRSLAKVYNGGNASGLVRDMVVAAVSGPEEVAKFNVRLMEKLTGQMALEFMHRQVMAEPAQRRKKGARKRARP